MTTWPHSGPITLATFLVTILSFKNTALRHYDITTSFNCNRRFKTSTLSSKSKDKQKKLLTFSIQADLDSNWVRHYRFLAWKNWNWYRKSVEKFSSITNEVKTNGTVIWRETLTTFFTIEHIFRTFYLEIAYRGIRTSDFMDMSFIITAITHERRLRRRHQHFCNSI